MINSINRMKSHYLFMFHFLILRFNQKCRILTREMGLLSVPRQYNQHCKTFIFKLTHNEEEEHLINVTICLNLTNHHEMIKNCIVSV